MTLAVGDDLDCSILEDSNAGVGGSKIDTNDVLDLSLNLYVCEGGIGKTKLVHGERCNSIATRYIP